MRGPGNRWGRWGRPLGMGAGHGLRALLRRENHFDRSAGHSIDSRSRDRKERFLMTSRATASQIGISTAEPRRWEHSTITYCRTFRSGAVWAGGARKMSKFGLCVAVCTRASFAKTEVRDLAERLQSLLPRWDVVQSEHTNSHAAGAAASTAYGHVRAVERSHDPTLRKSHSRLRTIGARGAGYYGRDRHRQPAPTGRAL